MAIAERLPLSLPPSRLPQHLIGAADRCCPEGLCVYRPTCVRLYLTLIGLLEEEGGYAAEAMGGALMAGRDAQPSPGFSPGSGQERYGARVWDIQRVQREGARSVEEIARRLCPYAMLDEELSAES